MDETTAGSQVTSDSGASGVESAGVAGQQDVGGATEATEVKWVGEEEQQDTGSETGVEDEDGAADQGAEEQPAAGQTAPPADKQEVAFAKRLAAERDKIRGEVANELGQEIQKNVFEQYGPIFELAMEEAQRHGMSPVEWARQARLNRESAFNQRLEELGIDKSIIESHPEVIRARQIEQTQQLKQKQESSHAAVKREAEAFADAFPGVKTDKIQPEVWQLRQQMGISLTEAYFRVNHKALTEQAKVKGEQTAIANIRGRESAATGPASGGAAPVQKTAWDYSKEDFEKLIDRAKAGGLRK